MRSWAMLTACGAGRHAAIPGQSRQRFGGHVLEFGADRPAAARHLRERRLVEIVGPKMASATAPAGLFGIGIETQTR